MAEQDCSKSFSQQQQTLAKKEVEGASNETAKLTREEESKHTSLPKPDKERTENEKTGSKDAKEDTPEKKEETNQEVKVEANKGKATKVAVNPDSSNTVKPLLSPSKNIVEFSGHKAASKKNKFAAKKQTSKLGLQASPKHLQASPKHLQASPKNQNLKSTVRLGNIQSRISTRFSVAEKKKMAEIRAKKGADGANGASSALQQEILRELEESMNGEAKGIVGDEADEKHVCLNVLKAGKIYAFVDLFYLTHRGNTQLPALDPSKVIYVSETLQKAEELEAKRDYVAVYDKFRELAEYFRRVGELKSAIFFYNKCNVAAASVNHAVPELLAESGRALGDMHMKLSIPDLAINFYQMALKSSEAAKKPEMTRQIRKNLISTYEMDAEAKNRNGSFAAAQTSYLKCLQEAQLLQQNASIGRACNALAAFHLRTYQDSDGDSEEKIGHLEMALMYAKKHLANATEMKDLTAEVEARHSMALIYAARGESSEASEELKKCREVAGKSNDLRARQRAARTLGDSEFKASRYKEAVVYLTEAFKLAKELGEKDLIDEGRVVLGTAQGKLALSDYMNVLQGDNLDKVLAWKFRREDTFSNK